MAAETFVRSMSCVGVLLVTEPVYWKDMKTLYFVFIPEIIFLNSIFGYLVILILNKWTTNWDTNFVLNNNEVVRIPQVA